jgi:hypothetical protein
MIYAILFCTWVAGTLLPPNPTPLEFCKVETTRPIANAEDCFGLSVELTGKHFKDLGIDIKTWVPTEPLNWRFECRDRPNEAAAWRYVPASEVYNDAYFARPDVKAKMLEGVREFQQDLENVQRYCASNPSDPRCNGH